MALLLATKLYAPQIRPGLVARPRLLQRLNVLLQPGCKLALISAPAGFGKSTLVTEWISQCDACKVCWLSLDEGDDDLGIFLGYLIAALQGTAPGVGELTQQMLEGSSLPDMQTLLSPLVNDLARIIEPSILVLDDYHVLHQTAVADAMQFLLEHLPTHLHMMLTTRQDPLLPLGRWRVRGQLVEIRQGDLRFSAEEASAFLNRSMGLGLKAEDVAVLENRTEGWIAGLQLAAISLQQSPQDEVEGSSFAHSFSGNDRYVMEYLLDEVLEHQPPDVQRFLLDTSVLERFNVGLCSAVFDPDGLIGAEAKAGLDTPQGILEYLDRSNLFLIPLDNHREWYRYHHLFAELLRHRLKAACGEACIAEFQRRASLWFDGQGLADEAIHYAQSAADWPLASRLILEHSSAIMRNAEVVLLKRWLAGLPDAVIRRDPSLCQILGYAYTVTGKLDLGQTYLSLAEEGFQDNPDALGSTLAFASHNTSFRGDFKTEIAQAERAMTLLDPGNDWMRGIAAVSLGQGLCNIGDPQGCMRAMQIGFTAGEKANATRTCVNSLSYMGRMAILRLDFVTAEVYFRRASHYQVNERLFSGSDMPLFDLAQLKYEQNELDEALSAVEKGLDCNRRSGSIEMRAYGYRLAARIHQIQGRPAEAQDFLQRFQHLAVDYTQSPLSLALNAAMQVEMALYEGDLYTAGLAAPLVTNALGVYSFIFFPETARVHLLLVQGKTDEALALLQPAIQRAEQPGWDYPRLQVRALQALAAVQPAQARPFLEEALLLAQPGGAVRTFVDLGAPMLALLEDYRTSLRKERCVPAAGKTDVLLAYLEHILAAFPQAILSGHPGSSSRANVALIEPLTERELEVLRLIASGLSNAEISRKLYLSPNTLKAHTQNIYTKLDAHSRMQAVVIARQLGVLESA